LIYEGAEPQCLLFVNAFFDRGIFSCVLSEYIVAKFEVSHFTLTIFHRKWRKMVAGCFESLSEPYWNNTDIYLESR
jgi:hypothetical protein